MASDLEAHRSAIEGRVKERWAETALQFAGVDQEPVGDAWLRVSLLWGDAFEEAMGIAPESTVVGVVVLDLFGAPKRGYGPLQRLGDTARDLFNMVDLGAVRFGPSTAPRQIEEREGWLQVQVSTAFELEETVN